LSRARPLGAAGCISATANINPVAINRLCAEWDQSNGPQLQQQVDAVRQIFQSYPMIAALKFATAHYSGNPAWDIVRPPLTALPAPQKTQLLEQLQHIDFAMPGLKD